MFDKGILVVSFNQPHRLTLNYFSARSKFVSYASMLVFGKNHTSEIAYHCPGAICKHSNLYLDQ